MTTLDFDNLLAETEQLFANVHAFECTINALPGKSHRGVCITHQDLTERRRDFVNELRNTMYSWVYSKDRFRKILSEATEERGGDEMNAMAFMHQLVRSKFRKGHPQGQFGELLLFNLIQHYFRAPPLLRKMPIQTSPAIERHGADAIHYRIEDGVHKLFLGEAKSYSSKYRFRSALEDAVESVLDMHKNFQVELGNFVYENFIDEDLRIVAKLVKNNKLTPVQIELVCIVSYEETEKKSGSNETELKQCVENIVYERLTDFDKTFFNNKCAVTLDRLHLIVMPIWDFRDLLRDFEE